MSQGRPLVRGLAIINTVGCTRALYGDAILERFVDRLTPAQRAEYEAGLLPGRWYDEEILERLCAAAGDALGDAQVVRLGAGVLKYHVGRAQRFLARIAGPHRVLKRAPGLWSYWRDSGRMVVEQLDKTSARVVIEQHPLMASRGYALLYVAASGYVVWLSGARDVRFRLDSGTASRIVVELVWAPNPTPSSGWHDIDAAAASLPERL